MYKDKSSEAEGKPQNKKKPRKRPPKKITESYLHNSGLYYLQRFAASKAHFKTVMLRKVKLSCLHHKDQSYEDCAALVDQLADKFEELGLINDDAYIRGMVTSLRRRGLSSRAITMRLQTKGIAADQTKQALHNHDSDHSTTGHEADLMAALTFCKKKRIGPFAQDKGKEEHFEKWLASLGRQGFSYETSRSVLETDNLEAEEKLYRIR